jgi:hypothetical protein
MTNTQFADALRGATFHNDVKLPMSKSQQYKKLSDYLQSCADPDREGLVDDFISSADKLPVPTLKRMAKAFSAAAAAKESSQSAKAQRLRRLQAAMDNQAEDPQVDSAVKLARGELRRLGLEINACPADGFNPFELQKKMKAENWSDERRNTLMACCVKIGLVE